MAKEIRALFVSLLLASISTAVTNPAVAATQENKNQRSEEKYRARLEKEVRHQLVMLPWYSVFDNLAFKADGDKVTLIGQVTRPTLKSDAEAAVKSIEGVASVVNNIEVLPVSTMIRLDVQFFERFTVRLDYSATGFRRFPQFTSS